MFAMVLSTELAVEIKFSKLDKVWNASPRDLIIPKPQILSIETGPELVKQIRGLRWPGTSGFGIRAGTFRQRHGVRHFWNIRKRYADHTIRFNLVGNKYKTVVVQVENPNQTIKALGY